MTDTLTFKNIDDYLQKCSEIMSADRNDLWPIAEEALHRLREWKSYLDKNDKTSSISSGCFELRKYVDEEGCVEWSLSRHVLDFFSDADESGHGFDWNLKLPTN